MEGFRFVCGLIVGAIIGALVMSGYELYHGHEAFAWFSNNRQIMPVGGIAVFSGLLAMSWP